jgi:hypothetical protein
VLAIGLIATALAYVLGIASTRMLGSRLASFVALAEVIAALLFGWLLLGQLPNLLQMLGGALVLVGVVVVKLGEPVPSSAAEFIEPLPEAPPVVAPVAPLVVAPDAPLVVTPVAAKPEL